MPRRYDSADAKRRIFKRPCSVLSEKSYTRTTVAEIVKEADVSISTFQNVFRTKDGVLVELVKIHVRHASLIWRARSQAKSCRPSMCTRWRPASSWL